MPDPTPTVKIGDRVRARYSAPYSRVGLVVALRGPFGPGGAMLYVVRFKQKPRSDYTEALAEQLEVLPPEPPRAHSVGGEQGPAHVAQQPDVQHG